MTADVADFVAVERIDCDNAQFQPVISPKHFDLLSNTIGHKIEDSCSGEVFGERPRAFLAGKVSAVAIPQDDMNRVPFAHTIM